MNNKAQIKLLAFVVVSLFALGAAFVSTDVAYADDTEYTLVFYEDEQPLNDLKLENVTIADLIDSGLPTEEVFEGKVGYEFKGWIVRGDETGEPINGYEFEPDTLTNAADENNVIRLDAEYALITYTVEFYDNNHESIDLEPMEFTVESPVEFPTDPEIYGYLFKNWLFSEDENNNPITSSANLTDYLHMAEESEESFFLFLVAECDVIEYSVKFVDEEGNDLEINSKIFSWEDEESSYFEDAPPKPGYRFMHWYLIDVSEEGDDVKNTIYDYGFLYDYFHLAEGEGDKRVITLIAKYELITYTVEFESEFIYDEIESEEFTVKKEIVFDNGSDFDDYVFKYWYLDIAGVAETIIIATSGDLLDYSDYASGEGTELLFVLTAHYEPIKFTVKFVDEGGNALDVEFAEFTVEYEGPSEFDEAPPITGYHFAYWYLIDEDAIGEDFDGVTEIIDYYHLTEYLYLAEGDGDERVITLIAKYALITYTVEFMDEKGESAVSLEEEFTFNVNDESKSFPFGDEVTGYLFDHWYVVGDDDKTSVTETKNLLNYLDLAVGDDDERLFVLMAHYEPIPYVVNFVDEDGEILRESITFTIEFDEPTDFGDEPYRAGYVFYYWYASVVMDDDEFDAQIESPEDLLEYVECFLETVDGHAITLIAKYEPITYTVEFESDWIYEDIESVEFTVEGEQIVFENGTDFDGYVFKYWYLDIAGEAGIIEITTSDDLLGYSDYASGEETELTFVLTAHYGLIEHTVEFVDEDGNILDVDSVKFTVEYEGPSEFGEAPSITGYHFAYWYLIDEDAIDEYFDGIAEIYDYYHLTEFLHLAEGDGDERVITLIAKYEPIIYTIIFVDEDGNSLEMDTETYSVDTGPFSFENAPTDEGYTFKGWYLATPQGEIPVSKSDDLYDYLDLAEIYEDEAIIYVTANFGLIEYTVKFLDINGNVLENYTDTYTIENNDDFDDAPKVTGYRFSMWFLADGEEEPISTPWELLNEVLNSEGYDGETIFTLSSAYEAIWYEVEFMHGEVILDMNTAFTVKPENKVTFENAPDVEGCIFEGWFVVVGSSNISVKASDDLHVYLNIIATEENEYRITLMADYEPIVYTIEFVNNKDNTPVEPKELTIEDREYRFTSGVDVNGYRFMGWVLAFDGEEEGVSVTTFDDVLYFILNDEYDFGTTVTLTSNYEIITYFVEFEHNGKPAVSPEPEFSFDVEDNIPTEFPNGNEIQGYKFIGWQIEALEAFYDVETIDDLFDHLNLAIGDYEERSLTLIAKYDPIVYTVEFVNDKDETQIESLELTIEDREFEFAPGIAVNGYNFDSWSVREGYEEEEEEGTHVTTFGDLLDMYFFEGYEGTSITLTAEYRIITYFVEFEHNGKPAVSPEPEFSFDVEGDASREFPNGNEIQGYEFVGWQIEAPEAFYDVENIGDLFDRLNLAEGECEEYYLTLIAKYDPIIYTVEFVNNKDNTPVEPKELTIEDREYRFTSGVDVNGYRFMGWVLAFDGEEEGVSVTAFDDVLYFILNDEYDFGTTVTLTSNYEIITYFVEFEHNGEPIVSPEPEFSFDVEDDTSRKFPIGDEVQGYEFVGWQIEAPEAFYDVETIGDLFDHLNLAVGELDERYLTLIAKYDPIVYTVNFVNNKDNTPVESQELTIEDREFEFAPGVDVRGYEFASWSVKEGEEEEGTHVTTFGDLLDMYFFEGYEGNTITLTAEYYDIIYTIEFEPREGVFVDAEESGIIEGLAYDDEFSLPEVSRDGYDFVGWFVDNQKITPETFWDVIDYTISEIEIVVKWQSLDAADISDGKLVVEIIGDLTYTGEAILPEVNVAYDGIPLSLYEDYTISYGENINVATGGTITIFGQDDYKGEFTERFEIEPRNIESVIIIVDPEADLTYTGTGVQPGITVTLDGNVFDATNYTVEYLDNVNAGIATVKITAKEGNYAGTATVPFVITAKTVFVTPESGQSKVYGEADPVLTYVLDDENAYEFIDESTYLVRADGVDVGVYDILPGTLAFKEGTTNYELAFSDETVTFEITAKDVNASEFNWDYTEEFVFDNTLKTVELANIPEGLTAIYMQAYKTDAGSYTATASLLGSANYNVIGEIPSLDWKIVPATVTATPDDDQFAEYGSIFDIAFILSEDVVFTGALALEDDEYYNVGNYTIVIGDLASASDNYVIVMTEIVEFEIISKKIDVIIEDQTAEYTGTAPTVNYTLSDGVEDIAGELSIGDVYDVGEYSIIRGTLDAGTNYELVMPENALTFTITAKDISDAVVDVKDVIYDGTAKTPAPIVKLDGEILAVTNYKVSYIENTAVGAALVTIEGVGNYTGTVSAVFLIKSVDAFIDDVITEEDEPIVEINETVAEGGIPDTVFQKLSDEGKTLVVDVVDENGVTLYSWTFEGEYDEDKVMDFKASIATEEPDEDLNELLDGAGVEKSVVLRFAASGTFPMTTSVKYYVGDDFESGATLSLYFFNTDSNELDELGQFVVDGDGYVTFALEHCSVYVLGEFFSSDGGAGAGSNNMLYIGAAIALIVVFVAIAFIMKRRG